MTDILFDFSFVRKTAQAIYLLATMSEEDEEKKTLFTTFHKNFHSISVLDLWLFVEFEAPHILHERNWFIFIIWRRIDEMSVRTNFSQFPIDVYSDFNEFS